MVRVLRRLGIALGSFVIAWLGVSLVAGWLFGSGNILVWVVAAVVSAGVYLDILRRDRRGPRRVSDDAGANPGWPRIASAATYPSSEGRRASMDPHMHGGDDDEHRRGGT